MTGAGAIDRGAAMPRRVAGVLSRIGLAGAAAAGRCRRGLKSMREAYPRPRRRPYGASPAAEPRPDGAVTVAVARGASGAASALLAAAAALDGRWATSDWSKIGGLQRKQVAVAVGGGLLPKAAAARFRR